MTRPIPTILLAAALCAACGCTPSRDKVMAMRAEADPAKSAANLADLLEHLEDTADPPDPDRRCAMLDVGADLARRVAGLQVPGAKPGTSPAELAERMHAVLRRDLDKPVTASADDLRDDGFDPARARSATATWAAWKLGAWPGAGDPALLAAALGRDDILADARLQAVIAAALLAQRAALESDAALAATAWNGALRVHSRHDAGGDAALLAQLDGLDLAVLDLPRLAAAIADAHADDVLRIAAVRQADRLLTTWIHDGAVPERHRAGLPALASALAEAAAAGPESVTGAAGEAAAGCVPWAFVRVAVDRPEGVNAAVLRCAALRVLAASPAALDPALYLPGADLPALRTRLVAQVLETLPTLPAGERWAALPPLATLAPGLLAERLSTAWASPQRAADWDPATWLAGLRLVATHTALDEAVRHRAAEAAAQVIAAPVGDADPTARWNLACEITAPWPSLRAQALAGAATAPPPADVRHLERLVRLLVAAALAIPEADRPTAPGWTAALDALALCARRDDLEPVRPGLRLLMDHEPGRLVEAMRARAAAGGAAQQEVLLLVDDALGGGRLAPPIRTGALDWLAGVATSTADDDVRLVAGAAILHHSPADDPRRARVAAALPILAAAGSR